MSGTLKPAGILLTPRLLLMMITTPIVLATPIAISVVIIAAIIITTVAVLIFPSSLKSGSLAKSGSKIEPDSMHISLFRARAWRQPLCCQIQRLHLPDEIMAVLSLKSVGWPC